MKRICISLLFFGFGTLLFGQVQSDTLSKKEKKELTVERLKSQKEKVERKEKQLLTKELIKINKALDAGEISQEEAEEQKKTKALKRAKNINDQQEIIQASIDLIARNKKEEDNPWYYKNLEFMGIKIDSTEKETKFHRTYKHLLIGAGFSNASTEDYALGDRFRVAGSRYFEVGYEWSTGLTADNFLRFHYGFLFQFDGFKPKDANQYFVAEENQVVLKEFPDHLKKAKLRTSNFIIPLHLEIGPTKENGFRKNFRLGMGGFAGLNLSTIQKLKYSENGHHHKSKNRFNSQAEDFVYGWSGYIGYKNTALILRYHMNTLFKHNEINDRTLALGIRWSL